MYVCVPRACLMPEGPRRGSWILWTWSDGWFVCYCVGAGNQTHVLQKSSEQQVRLTAEPSLQLLPCVFYSIRVSSIVNENYKIN